MLFFFTIFARQTFTKTALIDFYAFVGTGIPDGPLIHAFFSAEIKNAP